MSVATCLRTSTNQTSTSLDGIFNVIASQPQSTVVVKKVVAIAISQITYLRAICPPESYLDKTLDDLNLKILKESSTCQRASLLIKWLRGCFEALDKKYLRQIILGVFEDPNKYENLIESYNFHFNYIDDIPKCDVGSNNDTSKTNMSIKNSALVVIRNLLLFFQNLSALPSGSRLVMKLLYYDDVTPNDYHPSGFVVSSDDGFIYPSDVVSIRIGQLSTAFHTFKLKMNCSKQMISVIDGEDKNQQVQENVSNETVEKQKCQLGDEVIPPLNASEAIHKRLSPKESECSSGVSSQISMSNVSNVISSSSSSNTDFCNDVQPNVGLISNVDKSPAMLKSLLVSSYGTKCACGSNEDDGLMVLCAKCNFLQHAVCYKFFNKAETPKSFICALCAKFYNLNGTDSTLTTISNSEIKVVCLWRRIVSACLEVQSLNVSWIGSRLGVNDSLAQNICDKLLEMECITRSKRSRKYFQVNCKFIKDSILPRYFSKESLNIMSFDMQGSKMEDSSPVIKELPVNAVKVGIASLPTSSDDYKKAAFISTRKRKLSFQGKELSENFEFELSSQSQDSQSKKHKASITVESLQY